MTDWMAPATLMANVDGFTKVVHVLLGLYIWEWFSSLNFEMAFFLGKKTFRWPLTFYFIGRYAMLIAIIGVAITLDVKQEVDCQALFIVSQLAGNIAIAMASINLCLRTIVLWNKQLVIVIPLGIMVLGHCGLLLRGVIGVRVLWVPGQGCAIVGSQLGILKAIYIYSMCSDLIVLGLSAYKLSIRAKNRTALVRILFWDGLVYFIISFMANLLAVIFMILNLNPVLAVAADVPAVVICTIASCRVVRRLNNFTTPAVEMFAPSGLGSTSGRRTTDVIQTNVNVHIEMDKFPSQSATNVRLVGKSDFDDPEALQNNTRSTHSQAEYKAPTFQ